MKRKFLSLVLTLAMLASLLTPAFAAQGASFTDTDGHWAQASVDRWAGAGVMNGTGSGFQPDKTMTRAEFAQMLVNLLGYTEKAQNTFRDVPNDAWFADAVLKLAAAGVMQGDGVNANPNAEISRAEMAVLLCRALNIQPKASSGLSFADAASVPSWAEDAMAALAERGMLNGVGGNQVAPTLSVNRASVAKLLDNAVGVYANQPGQVISGEVKGLVIVVADGVTLKDATVAENIVVAPKAADASLTVTGKSTVGNMYVSADGAKLTVDKDAAAGDILVDAAKAAVTVDGKADAVMTSENASAAALSVGGTVSSVSLAGADSELKVSGTVKSVDISAAASGAEVTVAKGGSIDAVKTSADDVKIAGEGTVKTVTVEAGDKVAVDTKGTEVKVDENAGGVTAGGETVKPGESTDGGSTGGGSTGGGGGGGDTPGPTTVTLTLNANKGEFAAPTGADKGIYTISATTSVTVKADEFPVATYTDHTFQGWNTKADGSGTAVPADKDYTVTANATLYAQWKENGGEPEPITFTVTFDANNGASNPKPQIVESGKLVKDPGDPIWDGYTFLGWFAPQSEKAWDFDKDTVTAKLTLTANWKKNGGEPEPTVILTLKANGGEFAKPTGADKGIYAISATASVTVKANEFPEATYTDHTFQGWNTKQDGTGTAVPTGQDYTVTASTTLYAQWKENGGEPEPTTYTVIFNANGGKFSTNDGGKEIYEIKDTVSVSADNTPGNPTRDGYTFDGWYTAKDGGSKVEFTAPVAITEATTYYAHWAASQYTVTFDLNYAGADTAPNTQKVTYGQPYGTLPTPTAPNGYTFAGWYMNKIPLTGDIEITDSTIYDVNADMVLYAQWKPVDGGQLVYTQGNTVGVKEKFGNAVYVLANQTYVIGDTTGNSAYWLGNSVYSIGGLSVTKNADNVYTFAGKADAGKQDAIAKNVVNCILDVFGPSAEVKVGGVAVSDANANLKDVLFPADAAAHRTVTVSVGDKTFTIHLVVKSTC